MKCKELQIGNLLNVWPSLMTIRVSAVHNKKVGYNACTHKLAWIRQDLLRPIPLTEEILGKNFEKNGEYGYQLDSLWRIWSNSNYGYIAATLTIDAFGGGSYEPCIPCRYVHELQNLLKLLKINKEIIL